MANIDANKKVSGTTTSPDTFVFILLESLNPAANLAASLAGRAR